MQQPTTFQRRQNRIFVILLLGVINIQSSYCQQQRHQANARRFESHHNRPNKAFHQQNSYYHQQHQRRQQQRTSRRSSQEEKENEYSDNDNQFSKEEEKVSTALSKLFQPAKPRGLLHGAWRASKSTALGFFLGMTCLVTFPSASFVLTGALSFKTIVLSSILGAAFGATAIGYGLWNGLYQCYWGFVQTPNSIQSLWKDTVWNPKDGTWQVYDLSQQQQDLFLQREDILSLQEEGDNADINVSYYQLLGVPITASKSEIKRAYYQKAKQWHPDKSKNNNNEDNQKSEKFLQLHAAYQTLSDDMKRHIYDGLLQNDNNGNHDALGMDPYIFFSVLYDSWSLKRYTGELAVSTWARQMSKLVHFANDNNQDDPRSNFDQLMKLISEMDSKQEARQVDIAVYLRDSIHPFLDINTGQLSEAAFRQWCEKEAIQMLQAGIFQDGKLLNMLGMALQESANQYRGFHHHSLFGIPRGALVVAKRSVNKLSNKFLFSLDILWLVKYMLGHLHAIQNETLDIEQANGMIPLVINLAWNYNTLDIQSTTESACWKLFQDYSASKRERLERAKAVAILGQEFIKVANDRKVTFHDDEAQPQYQALDDPIVRMEIAMFLAQEKEWYADSPTKIREKIHKYLEKTKE